jgi:hypothetical protein
VRELKADAATVGAYLKKVRAGLPVREDYKAKVEWITKREKEAYEKLMSGDWDQCEPDFDDVCKHVLFSAAPRGMQLQLCVPRRQIDSLLVFATAEDEATFLASELRRRDVPNKAARSVADFRKWLNSTSRCAVGMKGLNLRNDDELCLVGSLACDKSENFKDVYKRLVGQLGMIGASCILPGFETDCKLKIQALVGENPWATLDSPQPAAIPLVLFSAPQKDLVGENSWTAELNRRRQASGTHTYLIGGRKDGKVASDGAEEEDEEVDDSEENPNSRKASLAKQEEPITEASHHVLWLPNDFQDDLDRVRAHLDSGEGETTRGAAQTPFFLFH